MDCQSALSLARRRSRWLRGVDSTERTAWYELRGRHESERTDEAFHTAFRVFGLLAGVADFNGGAGLAFFWVMAAKVENEH
jgi:hypothetical protein